MTCRTMIILFGLVMLTAWYSSRPVQHTTSLANAVPVLHLLTEISHLDKKRVIVPGDNIASCHGSIKADAGAPRGAVGLNAPRIWLHHTPPCHPLQATVGCNVLKQQAQHSAGSVVLCGACILRQVLLPYPAQS